MPLPTKKELAGAQSEATMAATRLHFALKTQYDGPIDVLAIARRLELKLMLQPLDGLLGFYIRRPEAAGIVINSRVPESLQRFTLAHEIGHHVLGHEGTADDDHTVDRFDPDNLAEVQAQAFAGALLMPLPLVNWALRDLPATRLGREVRDTDAYLFSRQLGVSFAAGVWTLYRRRLLTLPDARRFIKRGALAAKAAITGAAPRTNARADVWVLTEENDDLTVLCRVGDEIHVRLSEDTSSGRVWAIRSPEVPDFYHPATAHNAVSWDGDDTMAELPAPTLADDHGESDVLEVVQDEHLSEMERRGASFPEHLTFPDGGGFREVTFVPRREGTARVLMKHGQPWEGGAEGAHAFELELQVRSRQLAGAGLFAPDRDAWVDDHAITA